MVACDANLGYGGDDDGGGWQWIDYLYFLSLVKVGVSIVKYIPQVSTFFCAKFFCLFPTAICSPLSITPAQRVTNSPFCVPTPDPFNRYVQVVLNFRRKSTSGWQIWNILLDFSGGTLSIVQLMGDSMADARVQGLSHGWTGVIGNPAKFGLGLVSIFFDVSWIFMAEKLPDMI